MKARNMKALIQGVDIIRSMQREIDYNHYFEDALLSIIFHHKYPTMLKGYLTEVQEMILNKLWEKENETI